ncbi:hypothetical protein VPHK294_0052 [Vibrio phage K294]
MTEDVGGHWRNVTRITLLAACGQGNLTGS